MNNINELNAVALAGDAPEHGLTCGDEGGGVLFDGNGAGLEVEFVGYDGHTVTLLTRNRAPVRLLRGCLEGQSGGTAPPAAARMDR